MKTPIALAGALAGLALSATACGTTGSTDSSPYGSSAGSPSAAPVAVASPSPAPVDAAQAVVDVGQTSLGQVLVDKAGRTLYLFVADSGASSNCYGQCASYWPPLTTTGKPIVGLGANPTLIGTSQRTDGTTMVTYNGHPLYYFVSDQKAGDVKGQGINGFGGPWYVVSPSGALVR
jgi:predicted lipoprotein with Yx(FWY)xxD motif